MDVDVSFIKVGDRRRKDMGDLESLAASIRDVGLLHPLVVTPDYRLIVGGRRLAALKLLGRKKIPVSVVDNLSDTMALMQAERDENTCRKDFSLSEAVAMGKALKAMERPKTKARMPQAVGGPQGAKKVSTEKFSTENGRTLDKVSEAVGMSRITYQRTKVIVEAAEESPDLQPLVDEMDAKGKVNGAYRKMKDAKDKAERTKQAAGMTKIHAGFASVISSLLRWRLRPIWRYNPLHFFPQIVIQKVDRHVPSSQVGPRHLHGSQRPASRGELWPGN
jgi:ParB family chromosome partitioning protein